MESYEASRAVFSRIQTIDPENASKIMGYILLYHGEKDMIRLAYGPETLILSIINRAKLDLGLSSNTSSAPPPPPVINPISNPIAISRPNPLSLSLPSPKGYLPSSPSSPSLWSPHLQNHSPSQSNNLSYAAVVNGSNNGNGGSYSSSSIGSPQVGFGSNFMEDSNFGKNMDFFDGGGGVDVWENPNNNNGVEQNAHFHHRRSASFNENNMYYGTDESTCGFGYKPCLYYARGFCKNGSSCKFVHSDDNINNVGPPPPLTPAAAACKFSSNDSPFECQDDIFRSKLAHQQRLAAQLMSSAAAVGGGINLPFNKLNFIPSDAQRSAAAALMMGEEFHKLNRMRMARNEFMGMDSNPGARQIYLTFPADSTFKEEDVSDYFNKFGPVQDVRIPYQQKRMFGFVTFVYPETVKLILAKGNPHFVCDSRVLVKPYKEKGKLPDKKHHHQHQMDRGDFSCSSPSGPDCREPYDFPLGGRMYCSPQEMLLRKKLEEQAEIRQALEVEERRLINMQLFDLTNQLQQERHNVSVGSPYMFQASSNRNGSPPPSNGFTQDVSEENKASEAEACDEQIGEGVNAALDDSNGNVPEKEDGPTVEEDELTESFEHVLPDNLFASPKKSTCEVRSSTFASAVSELNNAAAIPGSTSASNGDSAMPATSSLGMAPLKSCFFEMPRISTGHGALGM